MQQIEYLFNLTLSVDAKNIALEKLKAYKKGTSVHAEATDLAEPVNRPCNVDDHEMLGVADADRIMDEPPQEDKTKGAVLPVTDKAAPPTLVKQRGRSGASETTRPRQTRSAAVHARSS